MCMKKMLILTQLGLVAMLAFSFFFAGCTSTSVPVAKHPPLYSQEKLRAVDHWDNIAIEVAERVKTTLERRNDLIDKPIYIMPPNDRPFTQTFSSLLHTQLVSRGMQVSKLREPDSIILEYNVQMVLFKSSRTTWLPSLAEMGIAVVGFVTGEYTTASQHEIIVNTQLAHNNRYAMHLSNTYYIDDKDWDLYISTGASGPNADSTRNVHITK